MCHWADARRICRVWLIAMLGCSAAWADASSITVTAPSNELSLDEYHTSLTLTVTNQAAADRTVRLRSPHAARLDQADRLFVPLADLQALAIKLDRLTCTVPPGQSVELPVRVTQRGPLLAGRYKLLFPVEDARTGGPITTGTLFVNVPPRIALAQPETIVVEAGADPDNITCLARFSVESNVRQLRVAVAAGDLSLRREHRADLRLTLDRHAGAQLLCRGRLKPESIHLALNPADTGSPATGADSQTAWVELTCTSPQGIDDDLFVRLRWRNPHRQLTPYGAYEGKIFLFVMPVTSP